MQGGTSKTVAIVYGTRLEAITVAPLIHALEGHPWLSTIVMTAGDSSVDDLRDVRDVFAIGPEAADPGSGPIAPNALAERFEEIGVDAVLATGEVARALGSTDDVSLVVLDRGEAALAIHSARLHLVPTEARAAELIATGVCDSSVSIVGDPAVEALGDLMSDSAGLPNDAMAAAFHDTPKWTGDHERAYRREMFLHVALVDPDLRSILAVAASPLDDGHVGERCVAALEQLLAVAKHSGDGDEVKQEAA